MKRFYVRWVHVDHQLKFFLVAKAQHLTLKFAVLGRTFDTLKELHAYRQGLQDAEEVARSVRVS